MRIGHLLARQGLQPLYDVLDRVVLAGTNVGIGAGTRFSGERAALLQVLSDVPTPTVLDVGANLGDYAADVIEITGGRALVHCFEPSPTAYRQLVQRFSGRPRVIVHGFGFGSQNAEVPLYADAAGSPLASVFPRHLEHIGIPYQQVETVSIRCLDAVARQLGLERVDLLKLDAEGAELGILQGGSDLIARGAVRAIQFEFGGCNIDSRTFFRDFWELLSPEYTLYRIVWDGLCPIRRYNERLERFVTTNYVAKRR